MIDHLPKQLEAWHDFYVVVGTGAAHSRACSS